MNNKRVTTTPTLAVRFMTKDQLYRLFNIEDLQDLPEAVMQVLEGDINYRNNVYAELLKLNYNDVSYDWFQNIYEEEIAQRKQNKQDFTPNSIGVLASRLTGAPEGIVHEPTAGNGSMIIADWWEKSRRYVFPFNHRPSDSLVDCWELSNRALPILLLNLSIRGMMGYVYHGDVLTREIKTKYILLNRKNDTLAFSEIIKDENLNKKIIQR